MSDFWTEPLSVADTAALFADVDAPWWIGGGWAVDLFLGRKTREHGDVDVCMLRRDQRVVHQVLDGWSVELADPPGQFRPWRSDEHLELSQDNIWARRTTDDPYSVWILLNESEGDDWIYHRDPRIRRPIAGVVERGPEGYPYLAPEVALLLKSPKPRDKDVADFEAALPELEEARRTWLASCLAIVTPGHEWIERLESSAG